jgi:hypothetical protein
MIECALRPRGFVQYSRRGGAIDRHNCRCEKAERMQLTRAPSYELPTQYSDHAMQLPRAAGLSSQRGSERFAPGTLVRNSQLQGLLHTGRLGPQ